MSKLTRIRSEQRGDTLVEVLLATVLLSVVLAGAYTLSNRATRLNQQAFERTQVSNLLRKQAELIRSARDSYIPSDPSHPDSVAWRDVRAAALPSVPPLGTTCDDMSTFTGRAGAIYLDDNRNMITGVSQTNNNLYNVWVEVGRGTNSEYWDVHVFGCWEGFSNNPTNITSIILRLEDPA